MVLVVLVVLVTQEDGLAESRTTYAGCGKERLILGGSGDDGGGDGVVVGVGTSKVPPVDG